MKFRKHFENHARRPETVPDLVRESFLLACQEGKPKQIADTLNRYPVLLDAADDSGWTPLHHAAMWAQTEAVQVLLDYGARTDLCDATGLTAAEQAGRMFYTPIAGLIAQTEARRALEEAAAEKARQVAQYGQGLKNDIAVRQKPFQIKK
jgi:hypothetical protein